MCLLEFCRDVDHLKYCLLAAYASGCHSYDFLPFMVSQISCMCSALRTGRDVQNPADLPIQIWRAVQRRVGAIGFGAEA